MQFHVLDPQASEQPTDSKKPTPTLIFLPSELCGWWALAALSARFESTYRIVLITWDGYGEAAHTPFEGIQQEATQLTSWIETHAPQGVFSLIGCGMGAQVAIQACAQEPHLTRSLVTLDALCEPVPATKVSAWLSALSWRLQRKNYLRSQMDALNLPAPLFPYFAEAVKETPVETVQAQVEATNSWRIPPSLARAIPALVCVGSLTSMPFQKSAQAIARFFGSSRLSVIQGAAQNELFYRQQSRAAELIQSFFEQDVLA